MFVTVRLMGGLGNQLFQIFAMLAYSQQYGHSTLFVSCDLGNRATYWETVFKELITTPSFGTEPFKTYSEPFFHYNPLPQISTDFELFGYFQSPKYFAQYEDLIFLKLGFHEKQKQVLSQYSIKETTTTIAMHFRLGDYKHLPDYHPILPLSYYEKALAKIVQKDLTTTTVLCFFEEEDDEFVWKERIQPLQKQFPLLEFQRIDTSIPEWQQMFLISGCRHFIIANSTFSWWGAYLGTTLNKTNNDHGQIICYPQTWFGPALADKYIQDLFPSHWNCIK